MVHEKLYYVKCGQPHPDKLCSNFDTQTHTHTHTSPNITNLSKLTLSNKHVPESSNTEQPKKFYGSQVARYRMTQLKKHRADVLAARMASIINYKVARNKYLTPPVLLLLSRKIHNTHRQTLSVTAYDLKFSSTSCLRPYKTHTKKKNVEIMWIQKEKD